MLLAALFLPLLNAAVKYLSGRYPVLELLWARYAGHLCFMLVVFAPRRGLTLLRSTRPLLQVSRSTLFCVSTFGMFYALGFVPLATAAAISFTAPLIVTALAPFALGERVGAARAIAVGVGFLGAMVVVRPGSGAYHWAVFLIFISAAASAVTQVLSRKLAGHDAPETSNPYMVLAGFVLASLPLPFVWHTPASGPDALVLCSLGVFGGLRRGWALLPGPGLRTPARAVCVAVQLRSDPRGGRAQLCGVRASAGPLDLDRERGYRLQRRLHRAVREAARSVPQEASRLKQRSTEVREVPASGSSLWR